MADVFVGGPKNKICIAASWCTTNDPAAVRQNFATRCTPGGHTESLGEENSLLFTTADSFAEI
jgi:hypothetical protein